MKTRYAFVCLSMVAVVGCSANAPSDPKTSLANVKADIEARTQLFAADLDSTAQAAAHALKLLEGSVATLQEAKAAAAGDSARLPSIDEQINVRNDKVAKLKELQAKLSIKKSGLEQFIRADLPPAEKTAEQGSVSANVVSAATLQADFDRAEEGVLHLTVEILAAVVEAHKLNEEVR